MTMQRKSVLENVIAEKNNILIEEIPFVGKLNIRGNAKDKEFLSNFGVVLEIVIPLDSNTKVAQTIFGKIPILIIRNHNDEAKHSYDIHVNRSHTTYLRDLLIDGCNQFIN